jgi:hypothetical protein
MNAALQLWLELIGLGVDLKAGNGRLLFHPQDQVTPELMERLKEHKADLCYLLTTTIRCPFCRSRKLLDGRQGLWCMDCERRAWIETDRNGIVRADYENQILFKPVFDRM